MFGRCLWHSMHSWGLRKQHTPIYGTSTAQHAQAPAILLRPGACMHAHDGLSCDVRWVPFALAALAVPIAASAERKDSAQKEGWNLLDLAARRRVFFKYEKRIRDHSAPDKARPEQPSVPSGVACDCAQPALPC